MIIKLSLRSLLILLIAALVGCSTTSVVSTKSKFEILEDYTGPYGLYTDSLFTTDNFEFYEDSDGVYIMAEVGSENDFELVGVTNSFNSGWMPEYKLRRLIRKKKLSKLSSEPDKKNPKLSILKANQAGFYLKYPHERYGFWGNMRVEFVTTDVKKNHNDKRWRSKIIQLQSRNSFESSVEALRLIKLHKLEGQEDALEKLFALAQTSGQKEKAYVALLNSSSAGKLVKSEFKGLVKTKPRTVKTKFLFVQQTQVAKKFIGKYFLDLDTSTGLPRDKEYVFYVDVILKLELKNSVGNSIKDSDTNRDYFEFKETKKIALNRANRFMKSFNVDFGEKVIDRRTGTAGANLKGYSVNSSSSDIKVIRVEMK